MTEKQLRYKLVPIAEYESMIQEIEKLKKDLKKTKKTISKQEKLWDAEISKKFEKNFVTKVW